MDNPGNLIVLRPTTPDSVGPKTRKALRAGLKFDASERKIEQIFADVYNKSSMCWTWNKLEGNGIIITCVLNRGGYRELFIDILAGMGYVRLAKYMMHDLQIIAKELDCTKIGAMTTRPALREFHKKLGWIEKGTYGVMELKNGW